MPGVEGVEGSEFLERGCVLATGIHGLGTHPASASFGDYAVKFDSPLLLGGAFRPAVSVMSLVMYRLPWRSPLWGFPSTEPLDWSFGGCAQRRGDFAPLGI